MTELAPRVARTPARAEPVGSLLRAPSIKRQMDELFEGKTTALDALVLRSRPQAMANLSRLGDEVIRELVQRQIAAGLDVITDGEVRRPSFWHALYDSVEGFDEAPERQVIRDASGDVAWEGYAE